MQLEGMEAQGQARSKTVGVATVPGCMAYEDFCSTEHVQNEPTP